MTSPLQEKVSRIVAQANKVLFERTNEIEGSFSAIFSGSHVLFLGSPGIAKSLLAEYVSASISNCVYFNIQLTGATTPDELYGPVDNFKYLKEGVYSRVKDGMALQCHIMNLDEVFKGSSMILNANLRLLNERIYTERGKTVKVPLVSCFGSSNELPRGDELAALYDRFLLRYWVRDIQDDSNFLDCVFAPTGTLENARPAEQLTLDEVKAIQVEVSNIGIPDDVKQAYVAIRNDLKSKGIEVSTRTFRKSVRILQAVAWIRGNDQVSVDELEVLADIVWRHPDDRKTVLEVVSPRANPLNIKALEFSDSAAEIFQNWRKTPDDIAAGVQANRALKEIMVQIADLVKDRPDTKTKRLLACLDKIKTYQKEVLNKIV